jgi:hypothetical protein
MSIIRKLTYTSILLTLCIALPAAAQEPDAPQPPAQDPIYDRPFITAFGGGRTAVGGYVEGNTNYFSEDGVSEGFSMELRRFNLFLYSSIGARITFFSELEFEHGTEEIKLETALIDFEINPALVLRGGILLPPLGAFNQNHDSPRWDFIDRPLVSTQIIPATLSEVGFGVHGRFFTNALTLGYQAYVVNGLGAGVIENAENRTFLPDGRSEEMFAEDNNGTPAFTARISAQRGGLGEVGLSYYGGVYNTFRVEGEAVDEKRRLSILALDGSVHLGPATMQGEAAYARIDVPESLAEVFGHEQFGGFVEVIVPVLQTQLFGLDDAVWNATIRLERIDYNVGAFASTGAAIYDDVDALVLGTSFRPTSETVFKANYRYHWIRDLLGNPTRLGGVQVGFATYF